MTDIQGSYDELFSAVPSALAGLLNDGDTGGSVAVFVDGEPVVDVWGGFADADRTVPWQRDTIAGVIGPYRASFSPQFADPDAESETAATMQLPPVPTLYLHGRSDGAIGAELLADVAAYLPAPGSRFQLLDGVGHFLHLERPQAVWELVAAWLAG